jgi:hypothetical protein
MEHTNMNTQDIYNVDALRAKLAPFAQPQPIKIVITCDGGLVQDVCSNVPVEFAMIDYDDSDVEDDRLIAIPQGDGSEVKAYAYTGSADVLPERTEQLFVAIAR